MGICDLLAVHLQHDEDSGTFSACWDILVFLIDSSPTSDTYYMIFNVDM